MLVGRYDAQFRPVARRAATAWSLELVCSGMHARTFQIRRTLVNHIDILLAY